MSDKRHPHKSPPQHYKVFDGWIEEVPEIAVGVEPRDTVEHILNLIVIGIAVPPQSWCLDVKPHVVVCRPQGGGAHNRMRSADITGIQLNSLC